MEQYKSNSHRSKEQQAEQSKEKRVEKVVSGKVTTKKNEGRKIADIFVSEDVSNVKSYLFMDVLVPAVKKLISDVARDGIDMLLYGRASGGSKGSSTPKISYRSYYGDSRHETDGYSPRSRFDYDDIVFETRGEAEVVRKHMLDTIERFGIVTVGDMYDMAGLGSRAPYTSHNYGWSSIRSAEPVRVKDGYVLKLPKAMPID